MSADPGPPATTRPTAAERVRAAPLVVWVYGLLAVAAVPYVGMVLNDRPLTDPLAWSGLVVAVALTSGLAVAWRATWPVAFAIDLFLFATALVETTQQGAIALPFFVKTVLAIGLLLSAPMRLHVFGSVEWRDDEAD